MNAIEMKPPAGPAIFRTSAPKPTERRARATDIYSVPHGLRDRIFCCADPRPLRAAPDEIRFEQLGPEDWENLEDALDDLPITTREFMICDELRRIDYETGQFDAWLRERRKKSKTEVERWYVTIATHKQRARRAGVRSELTVDEWFRVLSAASFRCVYCDIDDARTIDHVVAIAHGGSNTADNVVPACRGCNTSKNATPLSSWCDRNGRDFARIVDRINAVHVKAGLLTAPEPVSVEK